MKSSTFHLRRNKSSWSPATSEDRSGRLVCNRWHSSKCAVKGRHDFFCRKGYACINVQVVCDWNRNRVHIDPNYTGRTQDDDMFMGSFFSAFSMALIVL